MRNLLFGSLERSEFLKTKKIRMRIVCGANETAVSTDANIRLFFSFYCRLDRSISVQNTTNLSSHLKSKHKTDWGKHNDVSSLHTISATLAPQVVFFFAVI